MWNDMFENSRTLTSVPLLSRSRRLSLFGKGQLGGAGRKQRNFEVSRSELEDNVAALVGRWS